MTDTKKRQGLSGALKKGYGVGDFGFTLMTNVDTVYASYFFTNIAKYSLSVYTISTTISAIVDAILSMMYGAWLNKIKPKKWGRYRSWLVLTPWLVPFLYAFQYIKITDGMAGIVIITLAMITSRIAWNIPYIFAAYVSKPLVAKLGAKKTVVACYFAMAIAMLAAFAMYTNTVIVIALMAITMFFLMVTTPIDMELFANCADYSTEKLGYNTTGTVMGLSTVPIKVGVVARGLLIGAALALAGFDETIDPAAASESMQRGISMGFMALPAAIILVGAVILIFG